VTYLAVRRAAPPGGRSTCLCLAASCSGVQRGMIGRAATQLRLVSSPECMADVWVARLMFELGTLACMNCSCWPLEDSSGLQLLFTNILSLRSVGLPAQPSGLQGFREASQVCHSGRFIRLQSVLQLTTCLLLCGSHLPWLRPHLDNAPHAADTVTRAAGLLRGRLCCRSWRRSRCGSTGVT